ncbi:sugar ABC transporter ATP-binding protein [Paludibacterium purpuratum]|uniref:Ribose transport system ATP-binding protein n=1 Tax=Paludibacterium purpuratum TaxID=1144873 RepID=A0A4R7B4J3_9NEIS|nr:sugar ABC transporter ATP-binding protein [Paludibacterium purpuratum]TDR77904.1 ribose transport system ATP-binding protein [Paludibacterium purpuratum]
MSDVILEMSGICKRFGTTRALDQVHLTAHSHEVHALMGENGAGKSTLMKILSGIYQPDAGEIRLAGRPIRIAKPADARQAGINLIYQELAICANLSVAENIFMGTAPRGRFGGIDRPRMRRDAQRLLDRLGTRFGPNTPASRLSIADWQQVEIARALAHQSRILVMDEPTAALSDRESGRLFEVIDTLRDQGIAIIYISHRMEEVSRLADRITVLRDGCLAGNLTRAKNSPQLLIGMMVGRALNHFYPPKRQDGFGQVMLDVQGFCSDKIESASLRVRAGEILGLAGLVGAGRTELARLIFGADNRLRGRLRIDGTDVDIRSPRDAIRHGIGYLPEDRKRQGLFLHLSATANIAMNVLHEHARAGMLDRAALRTLTRQAVTRLAIKARSGESLVGGLSGGNQQKVLLARWLAIRPRVLILDEPTRGVDIGAKVEIYRIMHELAAQGVAIVCISSELPEIVGVCHRVVVLRDGRVAGELSGKEVGQEAIMNLATRH